MAGKDAKYDDIANWRYSVLPGPQDEDLDGYFSPNRRDSDGTLSELDYP